MKNIFVQFYYANIFDIDYIVKVDIMISIVVNNNPSWRLLSDCLDRGRGQTLSSGQLRYLSSDSGNHR